MKMIKRLLITSLFTLYLLCTSVFAQNLNSFSSGDPVSASKFNENFSQLLGLFDITEVSAMMICNNYGKVHGGTKRYFFDCESTDNQSFETQIIGSLYSNYNSNSSTAISIKSIFSEKWILQKTFSPSMDWADRAIAFFIFYKSK